MLVLGYTANWSSALAFAPIRRPAANKLKPPRPSAAFHFQPTPGVASGSKPTDAVRSAEALLNLSTTRTADALGAPSSEPTVEQANRTLPALMIEEDANKKRTQPMSGGVEAGGGKGRRKKKSKREAEKPSFNPLEPYDPSKPNDIEEYTRWRAEIKRQKEEEKRQRRDHVEREQSESEGSYYSEDERDEVVTGYKGSSSLSFGRPLDRADRPWTSLIQEDSLRQLRMTAPITRQLSRLYPLLLPSQPCLRRSLETLPATRRTRVGSHFPQALACPP